MGDPTIEMANRMVGEQEVRKIIDEIKKSGVKNEDFNFALMTRLMQREDSSPLIMPNPFEAGAMPSQPANWGVPPIPAGTQLPSGMQIPPQPMGPAPAPPEKLELTSSSRGIESPLGSPPITAQTGYYREEGSSDTRRAVDKGSHQ